MWIGFMFEKNISGKKKKQEDFPFDLEEEKIECKGDVVPGMFKKESKKRIIQPEMRNTYDEFFSEMKESIQFHNKIRLLLKYAHGDCLDVGCGNGYIITQIARKTPINKHMGVEYNPEILKIARANRERNVRIVFGDIRKVKINKKFDTIILSHVLEHMTDPAGLLMDLREKLKPKGNIIIVVPNKNGFMNTAEGWDDLSPHYWKFDMESLVFLLKQLGFSCEMIPTSIKIPFSGRICRRCNFLLSIFYPFSIFLARLFKNGAYELFFIVKPKGRKLPKEI